jgi:excisionase family DNA binding protein
MCAAIQAKVPPKKLQLVGRKGAATPEQISSPFVNRREAAKFLRLNIQSIDALIRCEKLPAYRPVGRRILIHREDLLRVVMESPVWEAANAKR